MNTNLTLLAMFLCKTSDTMFINQYYLVVTLLFTQDKVNLLINICYSKMNLLIYTCL